jgi:hypothetical protein
MSVFRNASIIVAAALTAASPALANTTTNNAPTVIDNNGNIVQPTTHSAKTHLTSSTGAAHRAAFVASIESSLKRKPAAKKQSQPDTGYTGRVLLTALVAAAPNDPVSKAKKHPVQAKKLTV